MKLQNWPKLNILKFPYIKPLVIAMSRFAGSNPAGPTHPFKELSMFWFYMTLAAYAAFIGYIIYTAKADSQIYYLTRSQLPAPKLKTPPREMITIIKRTGRFQPLIVEWPSLTIIDGSKRYWLLKPGEYVPTYLVHKGEPIDDLICPKCGNTGLKVPQSTIQICPKCAKQPAWAETLCVYHKGRWTRVLYSGRNGKWTATVDGQSATGRTRTRAKEALCSNLQFQSSLD